jgi:MtrB/PioB family decaheme-associated outer membrane protein
MGQTPFKLTALGAALLAIHGPAFADDSEIARLTKPDSVVSVGIGNWSRARPHQGIYDGMRDGKAYGLLDFDLVKRDEATGTWLSLTGKQVGTANAELGASYDRQGDFRAQLRYDQISRDNPYTFLTGTTGLGSTTAITPAVANPVRSELTLGTKRKQLDLDILKQLFPGLELSVNFKEERKTGTRQWGRGGAAEFAVEPIDATTRQLEIVLRHVSERLQLSGGYYGSWYDNANSYVKTTLSTNTAASHYYLSLPLDNSAHQFFVDGGYNFSPTTRGTLKLQYGRAFQNDRLPGSDQLPNFSVAPIAPSNLNGRIDSTLLHLGLTSRPSRALSLAANLRYKDDADKTPTYHIVMGGTPVHNSPYSNRTLSGKIEATYRLPDNFSLIGGVDLSKQTRSIPLGTLNGAGVDVERYVPFRSRLDEATLRLQLRRSLSETLNGSIAYLHGRRDGSVYSTTEDVRSDWINPIHIADRVRDKLRATADWSPTEAWSLQANAEIAADDYEHGNGRTYGLLNGKSGLLSLDASYKINDNSKLTAWFSHDRSVAAQANARFAQTTGAFQAERMSWLKDIGDSIGLGYRGQASGKLGLGMDLQWTRTTSQYPSDITPAPGQLAYPNADPLPDVNSSILTLKLFGEYALDKSSKIRIDMIHERWKTNDWTWYFRDGTPFTYGTTTDGTQVTSNPRQSSNYIGARYIYSFQ